MEPVISNGSYLANLIMSSSILKDSWNAISKSQGAMKINEDHPDYKIIPIVSSQDTTSQLQKERPLVPITGSSDFQFLCSDTLPPFKIDKAALSLFESLRGGFPQLQEEVKSPSPAEASISSAEKNRREEPVPYVITGRCLDGSVASLYTLSLLNTPNSTKFKLLCITFGSPLLGDEAFQKALSRYPIWNSSLLHVVHMGDLVARSYLLPPTTEQYLHRPFGTFLLCSESGWACFHSPESMMELLRYENPELTENQESRNINYEEVIERVQKKNLERDYEAGITGLFTAVGLRQHQQPDEGISALKKKVVEHEKDFIKQQSEELDSAELGNMKVCLVLLEWYINKCRGTGHHGPGYYDSFKNAQERHDNGVDKYKTYLTVYWEKVVEYAERKPQLLDAPLRKGWLFGGTNYRRIVEPLDIAEYYRRGRKDYITRGRSKHYERLENWLEDYQKKTREKSNGAGKQGKETQDGPSQSKMVNVTVDSCFWAHVEDAIRSCRLLDRARVGSSDDSEEKKPFDFEVYVMDLIKKRKVSSDIFLEKSSYMQWWREYNEILNKEVQNGSNSRSELVNYMMEGSYKNYGEGPSTSEDPHG